MCSVAGLGENQGVLMTTRWNAGRWVGRCTLGWFAALGVVASPLSAAGQNQPHEQGFLVDRIGLVPDAETEEDTGQVLRSITVPDIWTKVFLFDKAKKPHLLFSSL